MKKFWFLTVVISATLILAVGCQLATPEAAPVAEEPEAAVLF
jgi:hypothetical protein